MLTNNGSLCQVAADRGLADQARFNKLFRRFVGESSGMRAPCSSDRASVIGNRFPVDDASQPRRSDSLCTLRVL
jgi:hypothetical protein